MPSYKLTYFPGRGRAEVSRWLFVLAKQEYEDERVTGEPWQKLKPNTPFGQLPILTVDGVVISQSHAIARFLAGRFGLAGKDDLEKAKVDMIQCGVDDLTKPLVTIHFETKDEDKKAELQKKFKEETLPSYLGNFEKLVSDSGFFVGDGITVADCTFVNAVSMIKDLPWDNYPKLKSLKERVLNNPEIKAWIAKRPETSF